MGVEVYVGHLSGTVTEDEVRKLFSVAGTVTSVRLIVDPVSGNFRGCGYVGMSSNDEAKDAISLLDGAMLGERLIVVKHAPPKQSSKKTGPSRNGREGKGKPVRR